MYFNHVSASLQLGLVQQFRFHFKLYPAINIPSRFLTTMTPFTLSKIFSPVLTYFVVTQTLSVDVTFRDLISFFCFAGFEVSFKLTNDHRLLPHASS